MVSILFNIIFLRLAACTLLRKMLLSMLLNQVVCFMVHAVEAMEFHQDR